MCVCFQTIGKFGFEAELLLSIQTDKKRQRRSGAGCFHVLRAKYVPLLGLPDIKVLLAVPLISLQRLLPSHAQTTYTSHCQWNKAHQNTGWLRCCDSYKFSKSAGTQTTDPKWLPGHVYFCVTQLAVLRDNNSNFSLVWQQRPRQRHNMKFDQNHLNRLSLPSFSCVSRAILKWQETPVCFRLDTHLVAIKSKCSLLLLHAHKRAFWEKCLSRGTMKVIIEG